MTLYGIEFDGRIRYVGLTAQPLNVRYQDHWKAVRHGATTAVYQAMRKYGREHCRTVWLGSAERYADLKQMEVAAIRAYRTKRDDGGFNLTDGGDGTVGFTQPEHVRRAVAASNARRAGWHHTEDAKRAASVRMKGRDLGIRRGPVHSEAFKAALSARMKGHTFGLGRKHSEETKAKIARSGRSPERAAFLRSLPPTVGMLGQRHSAKAREKIASGVTAAHQRHRAECCGGRFHKLAD